MTNLTAIEFESAFGYNPIVELPELAISEDAKFTVESDIATINIEGQQFGSFDINTGDMV